MKRCMYAHALPWLIACVHANSWADPMRPLIPPAPASADAPPGLAERPTKAREPEGPREPERLVAIRQDSASRWQALFGERWVGPGDRLENYTVAGIEANAVHLVQLADGRKQRILHLLPPLWRPNQPSGPPAASTPPVAATATAAPFTQRAQGLPLP